MSTSRRRRSSNRPGRGNRTIWVPALRHRHTGRFILAAMVVLALVFAGMRLWDLRVASIVYGGVVPGASRADIRYFMGPPPLVAGGGRAPHAPAPGEADRAVDWVYDNGGARSLVRFAADDGVEKVVCSDPRGALYSCPTTLGISTGSGEDEIWNRLGTPSGQSYEGDVKHLDYRDVGLEFALRRGDNDGPRVIRITLVRKPSRLGYLQRMPIVLIP